jgi:hypothetical protein
MRIKNTGSHQIVMASRRAAASLSTKEEGCRSAKFGTINHRHHLLVSGIGDSKVRVVIPPCAGKYHMN